MKRDPPIDLGADEVRAILRRACADAGTVSAWARTHAMSVPGVHSVLQGRADVSATLAKKLGLRRVVRYIPMEVSHAS
jgi:hypothetical protein